MKPIVIHVDAEAEFERAVSHYERERIGLGETFRTKVDETLQKIRKNPARGTKYRRTVFRYLVVRPFRHVIFYAELDEFIFVSSISHGHRRPGHWIGRSVE